MVWCLWSKIFPIALFQLSLCNEIDLKNKSQWWGFNPEEDTSISCLPNALVLYNPVIDNSPKGFGHGAVHKFWEAFSPMHNISKSAPPTIFFLGTKDRFIPLATAEEYRRRMKKNRLRCDLKIYPDEKHSFWMNKKFIETTRDVDMFLVSLGYLTGQSTVK